MAGTVRVTSRIGEGSTFTVELPVSGCEQWAASDPRRYQNLETGGPADRRPLAGRILIADDSEALRTLCEHTLRRWGLHCQTVDNGLRVVEAALGGPDLDLILMDWQMPEMDGLAATRELRDRGVETPVVALTAAAREDDRRRCFKAGCDAYLAKPLDFGELRRLLRRLLAESAAGQGERPPRDDDPETLARRYVEGLPDQVALLRGSFERRDWHRLEAAIHRLAGTAGSYGLDRVFRAAEELERGLPGHNPADVEPLLDRLAASVERTAADSANQDEEAG